MYHAGTCRHRRCYVGLQFQCGPLKYHHNFLWTISFFCPVPPKSTKSGFFFYSDYFPPNTVERHLKAQRNWPLLALLVYFLCLVWKYSPLSLKVAEVCSILIKWISENTKHMDSWTIVLARFALKKNPHSHRLLLCLPSSKFASSSETSFSTSFLSMQV